MPGQRHWGIMQAFEGQQVPGQFVDARLDNRQMMMGINGRAALPRHMLDDTNNARRAQAVKHRRAHRCHAHRIMTKAARANCRMRFGPPHIEDRRNVHIDPDFGERQANGARVHPHRFKRGNRRTVVEGIERLGGGHGGPFRWSQAQHPTPFLINQDWQTIASLHRAQIVGQRPNLHTVHDITTKQDITRRLDSREKRAFFGR